MSRSQVESDEIMFERFYDRLSTKKCIVSLDEDMTPPEFEDAQIDDDWYEREEQDFERFYY